MACSPLVSTMDRVPTASKEITVCTWSPASPTHTNSATVKFLETGIQALRGRFVPSTGPAGGFTPVMDAPEKGFKDERVGVHAVLYPQPFGLQAEWNWGRGLS